MEGDNQYPGKIEIIKKAVGTGKKYFIVIANMATTMFGSVDDPGLCRSAVDRAVDTEIRDGGPRADHLVRYDQEGGDLFFLCINGKMIEVNNYP